MKKNDDDYPLQYLQIANWLLFYGKTIYIFILFIYCLLYFCIVMFPLSFVLWLLVFTIN